MTAEKATPSLFFKPCPEKETPRGITCFNAFIIHPRENVGLVMFQQFGNTTHINNIYVSFDHQKKGIGSALIRLVENLSGCTTLHLEALPKAVKFYEKIGFTCISRSCTKPCTQNLFPEPAQTSKLGSQESKP